MKAWMQFRREFPEKKEIKDSIACDAIDCSGHNRDGCA
jgi:hypothetical protein